MSNENLKQAFITLCIGVAVSFFATLFSEIAHFLNAHATEIISGGVSASIYGIRNINLS